MRTQLFGKYTTYSSAGSVVSKSVFVGAGKCESTLSVESHFLTSSQHEVSVISCNCSSTLALSSTVMLSSRSFLFFFLCPVIHAASFTGVFGILPDLVFFCGAGLGMKQVIKI